MTHPIEDSYELAELDVIEASWHQKELEERELIFQTIISHHELDLLRGTNTALAHAVSNGLKSEFEAYLNEIQKAN